MAEHINRISSRELAEWLSACVSILEAQEATLDLLGVENGARDLRERMAKVAQWLDNAKFEVRDPFACVLVLEGIRDSSVVSIERARELSRLALAGGSVPDLRDAPRKQDV